MSLEEHGAECGGERQRVEGRDTDGDGHGQTELAIEHTRGAAHERHRDKHEHHDKRNRDDGTADLAHSVDRGLARALVAHIELGVHGLDHDYGVVDHNRNRKHQSREGDKVDGEPDEVHEEECAHKSHRDGDGGNDGGADILKEHVNYEEHKYERLDESLDNLVDRGVKEVVVVHRHGYFEAGGKFLFIFSTTLRQSLMICVALEPAVWNTIQPVDG